MSEEQEITKKLYISTTCGHCGEVFERFGSEIQAGRLDVIDVNSPEMFDELENLQQQFGLSNTEGTIQVPFLVSDNDGQFCIINAKNGEIEACIDKSPANFEK